MTKKTDELGEALDRLVTNLVQEAELPLTDLSSRLSIFKYASTYWAARSRMALKQPEDDPDDKENFNGFIKRITASASEH